MLARIVNAALILSPLFVFASSRLAEAGRAECSNIATTQIVKATLESLEASDQALRLQWPEVEKHHGADSDQARALWVRQEQIDAKHMSCLERIVAHFGWPGMTQFGEKAAESAFLILQHSDLPHQQKYLKVIREAAARNEVKKSSLALLEDRIRVREGRGQIYGTQVTRNAVGEWEPHPIEDEAHVDAVRATMGLEPLRDYLQKILRENGGTLSPKWSAVPHSTGQENK